MRRSALLLLLPILVGNITCKQETKIKDTSYKTIEYQLNDSTQKEGPLFTLLDSNTTHINFINYNIENPQLNIFTYEYLYNGAGVAAGDINNDGLVDLYVSGNMVPNKLYLNEGNFHFRDITASSGTDGGIGFKTGVTMADVNNDGLLDIYVCKSLTTDEKSRKHLLYINNGDLTFTELSASYGLDDASYSTQAYFFDMDNDGDLDLFLLNHPNNFKEGNNINLAYNAEGKLELVKPTDYTYISDRLYENTGDNHFTDITSKAGMLDNAFGLSVAIGDVNNDGYPDLYVCNDYVNPDFLYINNKDGTFTESFSDYFQHSTASSMGSDLADINNDGYPDLMTVDMLPRNRYEQQLLGMWQNYDKFQKMLDYGLKAQYSINALQLNDGNGKFSDIGFLSNTAYTDWSWSVLFADLDNDGWKDIYVSNGYKRDITNSDFAKYTRDSLQKLLVEKKITIGDVVKAIPRHVVPSYLFRNNHNLTFSDVSTQWNSGPPAFSNGALYADLDNDGYLDLVVNNMDQPLFVFRNDGKATRQNHFIRFQLKDENKPVSGSQVKLVMKDGSTQVQYAYTNRGFESCVEPTLHFGLGKADSVLKAEIIWPDGGMQVIEKPSIDQVNRISKTKGNKKFEQPRNKEIFFTDISDKLNDKMAHQEDPYIDFKREPMLDHKYSEEGPATATADFNGDGLDDIFIGGAKGYEGKLFLQRSGGGFKQVDNPAFAKDSSLEDVAAMALDVNGDGKQDLVVISGGNEWPAGSAAYQDRLYLNDGSGVFKKEENGMPSTTSSGGCVAAADIDNDGDLDLFVGGRVTPGQYPLPPESFLFRNDKGHFTNVTNEWSEGLSKLGMLTDAKFADLDKDGQLELVVTGEWLPVTVFKKVNGKYVNQTASYGLDQRRGWWYSLAIGDMNGDGYPEIIAGNLGLNSHIRGSMDQPVTLYYKDFDNNGSIDPILCCYNHYDPSDNRSYPVHFRDRMLDQMVFLKKKFTRYGPYAQATINEIFTKEQLKDATVLTANTFESAIFINKGGKQFEFQALPLYTQISAIRSILIMDINKDGKNDLLVGGNLFGTDAQIGRYDASVGAVLLGDGKGGFKVVGPAYSGFSVPGNVRHLCVVKAKNGTNVIAVRNNDKCSYFSLNIEH